MPSKNLLLINLLILLMGFFVSQAVASQDWPNPPFSSPNKATPYVEVLTLSQNQTIKIDNVAINFRVTKPASWISGPVDTWITPGYICWGRITSIGYTLDGVQINKTSVNDPVEVGLRVYDEPPSRTLEFSFNLTGLSQGFHNLTVSAEGECLYYEGQGQNWPASKVVGDSSEIKFIVDLGFPTATPAPTTDSGPEDINKDADDFSATVVLAVAAASLIIVCVGVVFLYRRRHTD